MKCKEAVRIAEDVIAQLRDKSLRATHGSYIQEKFKEGPLKPQLEELKSCHTCGIGSMFVASVKRVNQFVVEIDDNDYDSTSIDSCAMRLHLKEAFYMAELWDIERVFEGMPPYSSMSQYLRGLLSGFVGNTRLALIMNEIIRQGGEFDIGEWESYVFTHPNELKKLARTLLRVAKPTTKKDTRHPARKTKRGKK